MEDVAQHAGRLSVALPHPCPRDVDVAQQLRATRPRPTFAAGRQPGLDGVCRQAVQAEPHGAQGSTFSQDELVVVHDQQSVVSCVEGDRTLAAAVDVEGAPWLPLESVDDVFPLEEPVFHRSKNAHAPVVRRFLTSPFWLSTGTRECCLVR
jgi:hypothetical protein